MVLLKRRNIFELCAMKQWKRWLATVRGAKRMRAGGSPLRMPMSAALSRSDTDFNRVQPLIKFILS